MVARKKFVSSIVRDNTQLPDSQRRRKDYVPPNEKIIVWDLRYADMREKPTHLQFHARLETPISGLAVIRPRPGMSLKWKGIRIRGVNWNLVHPSILNGQQIKPVRGWHEKQWTDADEDKHIIDINDVIRNTDFRSIIRFCCNRWNIEFEERQTVIGDL